MNAEKLFGTRNLYEILQLKPNAQIQDGKISTNLFFIVKMNEKNKSISIAVKKSYYRLALMFHPDRVTDEERSIAMEKFNIIHNAYSILSDSTKKGLYDNGSAVLFTRATIAAQWENFLKEVNENDIDNARKNYQGSLTEKNDLIREFAVSKGSMTHLLNSIPFMRIEDEARIIEMIKVLMDDGLIQKIPIKRIRK